MPNGFKISTWTEALALLSIVLMAVAGLAWGLKLDGRTATLSEDHATVAARQDDVRDRLARLEERVKAIERQNGQ